MTTIAIRHREAALLYRLARVAHATARVLGIAARRLDRWLEARRSTATALRDLDEMSDYELRDIGLSRADIESAAKGRSPRSADDWLHARLFAGACDRD